MRTNIDLLQVQKERTMSMDKFLFNLKNDKDVRKWSIASKDKIKWKEHLKWLDKHYADIYVIFYNMKMVGDVRVDKYKEIAIKIDKDYRGLGLANIAISFAKAMHYELIAKIVDGNVPSMRLFIKNDFKVVNHKVTNGVGYYILKYEK